MSLAATFLLLCLVPTMASFYPKATPLRMALVGMGGGLFIAAAICTALGA